jgi:hypothetical protein
MQTKLLNTFGERKMKLLNTFGLNGGLNWTSSPDGGDEWLTKPRVVVGVIEVKGVGDGDWAHDRKSLTGG